MHGNALTMCSIAELGKESGDRQGLKFEYKKQI